MKTRFWIKNISVISMVDDKVAPNQDVLIDGDKIAKIALIDKNNKSKNDIDGTGKFLMPGLVDGHVHLHNRDYLPLFLANGITTVRDTGNSSKDIFKLKQEVLAGESAGPTVYSSGKIIEGNPPLWNGFAIVKNKNQVAEAIKEQKQTGADFIKIYGTLSADLYKFAIKEAHRNNLKVTGHISKDLTPIQALQMGLDGIEHIDSLSYLNKITKTEPANLPGYEDYWQRFLECEIDEKNLDELLKELKKQQIFFCPTLIVMQKLSELENYDKLVESDGAKYMSAEVVKQEWNPNHKNAAPNIKGVKPLWWRNYGMIVRTLRQIMPALYNSTTMLAGSDTPNPFVVPGFSLHEELNLMVESGLTPYQVLRTATVNPAKFLGIFEQVGTIESGKLANLIMLSKNPLQGINNITSIESTFVLGKKV